LCCYFKSRGPREGAVSPRYFGVSHSEFERKRSTASCEVPKLTEVTSQFSMHRHPRHARMAPMGQEERVGYRPALDGLRGIAVLLVVLTHSGLPHLDQAGSVGVTLFFVLSGFLITRLLSDERERTGRINFRRFYARRARRLFPALGLLLIAVTASLLYDHQSLLPVVLVAGYSSNIANATGHSLGSLDHAWTLSLEEQFYLLWPLLTLVLVRRRNPALVLLIAAALSAALRSGLWLSGVPIFRVYYAPDTRADAILIGCALAFVATRVNTRWLRCGAVASAVLLVAACAVPWSILIWLLIPLPLASAALILWSERHPPKILIWRPLVATGKISYGLYLWNYPVSNAVHFTPLWARTIVFLVCSFAMAVLSWYVIERPFRQRPARVTAAASAEVVALTG
jgi:peptidoglycan/LPS O-acetylase OafA/YrhL